MTSALRIRPGVAADLDAIGAIDPMTRLDAGRRGHVADWLGAGRIHLAERDDAVVGFVALTHLFYHPFVELLFVGEAVRRQGIARALLQHCIAVTAGGKLFVSTNESNAPMRALISQLGFIPSGAIEHIDDGDPELYFVHLPG